MPNKKTSSVKPNQKTTNSLKAKAKKTESQRKPTDILDQHQKAINLANAIIKELAQDLANPSIKTFKQLKSKLKNTDFDDEQSHLIFDKINDYLICVNSESLMNGGSDIVVDHIVALEKIARDYFADKWRTKTAALNPADQLAKIQRELARTKSQKTPFLSEGLKSLQFEIEEELAVQEQGNLKQSNAKHVEPRDEQVTFFILDI